MFVTKKKYKKLLKEYELAIFDNSCLREHIHKQKGIIEGLDDELKRQKQSIGYNPTTNQ